jgi:hypothetical protein
VIDWGLSGREIQVAQALILIATATLIGGRFLPQRYRWPVGLALTVGYLAGVAVFIVWALVR